MATLLSESRSQTGPVISWEALPDDFQLEDEPVDNTGQPLLAGALSESLEISGFIQPQMLIADFLKTLFHIHRAIVAFFS